MNNISLRRLGSIVRKLHLHNGDILLIKSGTALATMDMVKHIADNIGRVLDIQALLLVDDDLNDLKAVDAKAMYEHGWVRIDSLAELFQRKRGISPDLTKSEIKEVMDAREDGPKHEGLQE